MTEPPADAAPPLAPATPKPVWELGAVPPQWLPADDDPLVAALRAGHGAAIVTARSFAGDLTLAVDRHAIAEVATTLRDAHGFSYLIDICGADYPRRTPRFEVIYHLHQFPSHRRLRLKVTAEETEEIPTLTGVFRGANWPEREVFDLYGLRFAGHPDLSRILTWDGFNGHPLRKDFPVEGIDTGAAIYPESYEPQTGPLNQAGTGWLVKDADPDRGSEP